MLDNVIRFFTQPINPKEQVVKVKPLNFQTFYSTNPTVNPITMEQATALLNGTEFKNAKVEKHTLKQIYYAVYHWVEKAK